MAALAAALKDPDESIRRRVALALGKIGPAAAEAVAALATPLKEDPALKGGRDRSGGGFPNAGYEPHRIRHAAIVP